MRTLPIVVFAAAMFGAAASPASAVTVYIEGNGSGCNGGHFGPACANGPQYLYQGDTINVINPVQVTLGPGLYTITNAAPITDPNSNPHYWAWNYSSGWAWNWGIATDNGNGTGNVFFLGYSGGTSGSQAGMASSHNGNYGGPGPNAPPAGGTGPADYSASFILLATTTLDFFVMDYYLPDNGGGIALNINGPPSATPLPAALPLFAGGLGVVGWAMRRRKKTASA